MTNTIIVSTSHDCEDTIEGPNWLYRVVSCDVDQEAGTLVWDRVVFPNVNVDFASSEQIPAPMVSQRNPTINHVKDIPVVGDDVLSLLRDRGESMS